MKHTIQALIAQTIIGLILGNWWIGALIVSGYFIGREVAQAEYRWIEHYGSGSRANMAWYRRFDPRAWDAKALADWVAPMIVTFLIAGIIQ